MTKRTSLLLGALITLALGGFMLHSRGGAPANGMPF